jgi:hypothetical protein
MHRSMNGFNELSIAGRVATPNDSGWDPDGIVANHALSLATAA